MCNGSYHVHPCPPHSSCSHSGLSAGIESAVKSVMPFLVSGLPGTPLHSLVYSLARFLGGTAAYTVKLAFKVWGLLLSFQHYYVHSFCSRTGQIVTQTGNKGQKERPKSRKQFVWPNTSASGGRGERVPRVVLSPPLPLARLHALPSSGVPAHSTRRTGVPCGCFM